MADSSKGMAPDQVEAISAEGSQIVDQLQEEAVKKIFNQV